MGKVLREIEEAWRRDGVPTLKLAGNVFLGALLGPAVEAGRQVHAEVLRQRQRAAEQKIIDAVLLDEDERPSRKKKER